MNCGRATDSLESPVINGNYKQSSPDPEPYLYHDESTHINGLPDLTQALSDLLARIADVSADKLHESAMIEDLGIDSLMWIEVADEINKYFAIDIDMTEFMTAENMKALCQLVANKATGYSYNPKANGGLLRPPTRDSSTAALSSNRELSNSHQEHEAVNGLPASRKPAFSVLDSAFKAFDDIQGEFDVLARDAGCDRFWSEVHPVQTSLIEAYIVEAFTKLGCDLESLRAGEEVPLVSHKPECGKQLNQLMLILRDNGLISQSGKIWFRTDKRIPTKLSSTELFEQIKIQFSKWIPEHELLHIAGSNLAGYLAGTQNSVTLFFGNPERRKLMADQYLSAPIQSSVSRQLASFVGKCFGSYMSSEPLQILEIGGGTCGTTVYALDAFVKSGVPFEYTFTDISPSFITAAKSKLKDYKSVKYQTLDVSKSPSVKFQAKFDMIIATNVIHATPDACNSAENVRQMLREGGFFAMVEYTHIYPAIDVIFGQFDGWWAFDDGRTHAIMDTTQWNSTLRRAGYSRISWTGSQTKESKIMRIFLAC